MKTSTAKCLSSRGSSSRKRRCSWRKGLWWNLSLRLHKEKTKVVVKCKKYHCEVPKHTVSVQWSSNFEIQNKNFLCSFFPILQYRTQGIMECYCKDVFIFKCRQKAVKRVFTDNFPLQITKEVWSGPQEEPRIFFYDDSLRYIDLFLEIKKHRWVFNRLDCYLRWLYQTKSKKKKIYKG